MSADPKVERRDSMSADPRMPQATILVAERDPDIRRLLVDTFSKDGWTAVGESGEEAGQAEGEAPDFACAGSDYVIMRRPIDSPGSPSSRTDNVLVHGRLRLDSRRHEVFVGERRVELSVTEFAILELLLRNPETVFSRSRIIQAVQRRDVPVSGRSVDVQILSLRRKLGDAKTCVETVRGIGYRLS
jgi:DNA-binding response OmpR family regulator